MQLGFFDETPTSSVAPAPLAPAPLAGGPYVAYCDGACKGNQNAGGGPGGWGVVLKDAAQTHTLLETCGGATGTTNNKMELTAVIEALKLIAEGQTIEIRTDSQYVQKGLSEWAPGWKRRGWKTAGGEPVKNVELWKELDALAARRKVRLTWVRGHNGDAGNERADELANQGVPA